jgi:hypothetical protein
MERIKTLIQKLQEVYYSKHSKTAIDIDLMMDYTRVLYMDLLEWRKDFVEPVHSDVEAVKQANTPAPASVAASPKEAIAIETPPAIKESAPVEPTVATPAAPTEKAEEAIQQTTAATTNEPAPEQPIEDEATKSIPEAPLPIENNSPADVGPDIDITKQDDLPPQPAMIIEDNIPETVHPYPEQDTIAALSQEHSGISFEPPFQSEKPTIIEETIAEEAPSETHFVEDMPAPAPAEIPLPEVKQYTPPKLFDNFVEHKDIRTSIGINDKYLFLNELFNNHKSDYEETLDKLNQFDNLAAATDWAKTKVAVSKKWDNADPTVQSFYALLDKHFAK